VAYPRSKPRWRWLCRVQNPCGDKRSRCVSPDMDRGSRVRCDGGVLSVECEPSCCPAVGASPTVTSSTCSTGRRESADVSTQDESDVSSRGSSDNLRECDMSEVTRAEDQLITKLRHRQFLLFVCRNSRRKTGGASLSGHSLGRARRPPCIPGCRPDAIGSASQGHQAPA
jgi:hypothetical protein